MRYPIAILAAVAALLVLAAPALAGTVHVDVQGDEDDGSCAPGDCSLREAVKYAMVGDLIDVPPGNYTVASELVVPRTMTIDGAGPASTVITANGSTRTIHATAGPLTLRDLTVTGGNGNGNGYGGGIFDGSGELLTLDRVRVTDNSAHTDFGGISHDGGGGLAVNGPVRIVRSTIDNNASGLQSDGELSASGGAGVYVFHGAAEVIDSEIRDNHFSGFGALVTDQPVDHNGGGGIHVDNGSLTLVRSTLAGNDVGVGGGATSMNDNGGGGIYMDGGNLTAVNSTITDNEVHVPAFVIDNGGGGIFTSGATASLVNVTLSHNEATGGMMDSGGGLYRDGGAVKARGTIIAKNTADVSSNCFGAVSSQGRNLEDAKTCGLTGATDIVGVDPLLGALAANGGPTRTRALGKLSPAIDTGSGCPGLDQRGVSRPKGNGCDRGAYEAEIPTVVTGAAKKVGLTGAKLNGKVTPNGKPTVYRFQYGKSAAYGKSSKQKAVGAGSVPQPAAASLKGLKPRTTYHYRIVATNLFGTTRGRDRKFTTRTRLPKRCVKDGELSFKLKAPEGTKIESIEIAHEGLKRTVKGRKVTLTGLPDKRFKVRVKAHLANGTTMRGARTYGPCE
jgi:CSLREA domain-containing protein